MYKLVAIDLDGTLLNSKKQLPEENVKAIKMAVDKGVTIVLCSGRIFKGAMVFARQLGLKGPLIACNGAIIRDMETGSLWYDHQMKSEDCCRIVNICREENIYFHAYVGDTMFANEMGYGAAYYVGMNELLPEPDRVHIRIPEDFGKTIESGVLKPSKFVVSSDNPVLLSRVRGRIDRIEEIETMSSNFDNFEIVCRGVGKGSALKILSERLNIGREEIIAIGDNENDRSMIEFAGLGIAMGNAESYIKDIAGYITLTNDQNGVAEALKKFVL